MLSHIVLRRGLLSTRLIAARWPTSSSAMATVSSDDYSEKKKEMNRPLSPWIQYKWQMTNTLSITHRITGMGLAVLVYGGGIGSLFTSQTNFPQILQWFSANTPPSLLLTLKVLIGTSLAYHTFNGLRHLGWDYGFGFDLKQLYTTGYAVIGLTLLTAIAIVLANQ
ncbi:succinate dehydrogenase cytochrome b560 subunit, mitochondrial-like [Oppia nitens]|uniref:succinate dehydrogenase cytochrome b560 subunit, mitochondrial-like n=1 Tax=Oppia nitens TaxID=1686743 RepID=UPI0023DAC24C|nr:succinate dehydrogenase cytochrome b560 subunit, mitochondrial-like [Oppia nitens]